MQNTLEMALFFLQDSGDWYVLVDLCSWGQSHWLPVPLQPEVTGWGWVHSIIPSSPFVHLCNEYTASERHEYLIVMVSFTKPVVCKRDMQVACDTSARAWLHMGGQLPWVPESLSPALRLRSGNCWAGEECGAPAGRVATSAPVHHFSFLTTNQGETGLQPVHEVATLLCLGQSRSGHAHSGSRHLSCMSRAAWTFF